VTVRALSRGPADLAALLGLAALLLFTGLPALRSTAPPAEDAAMLLRYAGHLAAGHGMVWNLGEPPCDGATDFLFALMTAGLAAAGLSLETAVRALGLAAHALTVGLVYWAVRRFHGLSAFAAWISAAFVALGPATAYVESCFGTPVFAFAAALTWSVALRLRRDPESIRLTLLFSLAGLVTGLIRPEGVFLAGLMALALPVATGLRRAARPLALFVAVFAILGGAFFLWRWSYFGQPLPTPFYKKGGGLHWGALYTSVYAACRLCFPFLLLWPLALRSGSALRRAAFSWIPAGGFILLWVLLSDEMNILFRFQYAVVPLVAMSWPDWVAGLGRDLRLPALRDLEPGARRGAVLFLAVAALGALAVQLLLYRHEVPADDGRREVGKILAGYRGRGYTLVTSEAGLLPFYSGWRSVDAWGLNDPEIARRGLTTERLEREHPEVIAFHAYRSPLVPAPLGDDPWSRMVATLESYARTRGYVLAASFGHTPFETHTYYVRSGFPGAAALVARIRAVRYVWYAGNRPAVDFAAVHAEGAPR
jgi:hypothetical protein